MASEYWHESYNHYVGKWYYTVREDQINSNTNTSRITVDFYVQAVHGGQYSATYNNTNNTSAKIWINGTQVCSRSPAKFDIRSSKTSHGTNIWLGSGSATVTHNSSGGGSLTIKCHHNCGGTSPKNVYLEDTYTLQRINVQPKGSLTFDDLYAVGELKPGNSLTFRWEATSPYSIRTLSYSVTGAFSMSGSADNLLGSGGSIPAGIIPKGGTVTLTVTIIDAAGNTATKSITLVIGAEGALLSLPGGTYNIGSTFNFTVTRCHDYLRYSVWYRTNKNSSWIQLTDKAYFGNGNKSLSFTIPNSFKSGVANQGTDTMHICLYTYQDGNYISEDNKSVTIKNNDYQLYFNDLYIHSHTYTENGKYTAGKTAPLVLLILDA